MDCKTRLGLELLGTALVLGLLGDVLLRAVPWGVNAFLWAAALAAAAYALSLRWHTALAGTERWWILPVAALALLYVWRDAPLLKLTNTMALVAALAFVIYRAQAVRLQEEGEVGEPPGMLTMGLRALLGLPAFVLLGIDWQELPQERRLQTLKAVGRGVLMALPVLCVFGLLLTAADAAFERMVLQALDIDVALLPERLLVGALCAWAAAAFLRGIFLRMDTLSPGEGVGRTLPEVGAVEGSVVLALVNALFLTFVLVQLRYLFGGAAVVAGTEELTLAQYARRGFFELVTVAALALPFLLGLRRLVRVRSLTERRRLDLLIGAVVVLLCLILVSAARRMWLYEQAFGLTVLRLYVSAAMVWLGLVLVWFAMSVLRNQGERFAPGAAAAGLAVVLALHALNPDALIAHTNLARAREGEPLDVSYVATLSSDAVPVLLEALPTLPPTERAMLAEALLRRSQRLAETDWRLWNRSRASARQRLQAAAPALRAAIADRRVVHPWTWTGSSGWGEDER